jgi:LysM repeat protein
MKSIIPYEHDIVFDTKIAEITSISLEHDDSIKDTEISGDFIVSGDYKVHAISVNKEPFKYRLPFAIELADNIIRDSINYDINDFTYEIKNGNTLTVKIEVVLEAEEVEDDPPVIPGPLPTVASEKVIEPIEKEQLKPVEALSNETKKEEALTREINALITDNAVKESENNHVTKSEELLLNSGMGSENTYITYHIHIIKETDSIESICSEYKVSKELLQEYNDLKEFKIGSKILIPELKDE